MSRVLDLGAENRKLKRAKRFCWLRRVPSRGSSTRSDEHVENVSAAFVGPILGQPSFTVQSTAPAGALMDRHRSLALYT